MREEMSDLRIPTLKTVKAHLCQPFNREPRPEQEQRPAAQP